MIEDRIRLLEHIAQAYICQQAELDGCLYRAPTYPLYRDTLHTVGCHWYGMEVELRRSLLAQRPLDGQKGDVEIGQGTGTVRPAAKG